MYSHTNCIHSRTVCGICVTYVTYVTHIPQTVREWIQFVCEYMLLLRATYLCQRAQYNWHNSPHHSIRIPFRISIRIPTSIRSLIFHGTGCTSVGIPDRSIGIPDTFFWVSPITGETCLHPYLLVSIGIDLLSDGDSVSTNVNLFGNLGTPVKTCVMYGVWRHGVLRRCLTTVSSDVVSRQCLQTVSSDSVLRQESETLSRDVVSETVSWESETVS